MNLVRGLEFMSSEQFGDPLAWRELVDAALAGDPDGRVAAAAVGARPAIGRPGTKFDGRTAIGMTVPARVLLAMLLFLLMAAVSNAEQRVALVIGNGNYSHASVLANPPNDAADVAAALERLGFAVTRLDHAGKGEMERVLQNFSEAAYHSEVAVVFYAGHGIEVDGQNYLVPVDARLATDRTVKFETVPLDLVLQAAELASGFLLVVLDACRDNPFASSMRRTKATRSVGTRGLTLVDPSGDTLVAAPMRRRGGRRQREDGIRTEQPPTRQHCLITLRNRASK